MRFLRTFLQLFKLNKQDLKIFLPFCIVIIFADLLSKQFVFSLDAIAYYICNILNILKVKNYGVSFGLFNENPDIAIYFIVIFDLLIITYLLHCFQAKDDYTHPTLFVVSISSVLGGAFGNLIDRLYYGFVRDFIDVHWKSYHWPCFNVADVCICVGVGCLVVCEVFFRKKK